MFESVEKIWREVCILQYSKSSVWKRLCFGVGRNKFAGAYRSSCLSKAIHSDILEEYVLLFSHYAGGDNTRQHTANIVTQYLNDVGITAMERLAHSPDLNPIRHLRDKVGKQIWRRLNPLDSLQQLRHALIEEWLTFQMIWTVAGIHSSRRKKHPLLEDLDF